MAANGYAPSASTQIVATGTAQTGLAILPGAPPEFLTAVSSGFIGFVTDDEEGKAERYIAKLKAKFPTIEVIDQKPATNDRDWNRYSALKILESLIL